MDSSRQLLRRERLEGDVDWNNYLKALEEIGYDGFLTIERECGDDPAADIAKAVAFLKKQLVD